MAPNEKVLDVSNLLEEVLDLYQDYFKDLEFLGTNPSSEEFEKSKIEFKNSLGKIYLKIQKFLNEELEIILLFLIILSFIFLRNYAHFI